MIVIMQMTVTEMGSVFHRQKRKRLWNSDWTVVILDVVMNREPDDWMELKLNEWIK